MRRSAPAVGLRDGGYPGLEALPLLSKLGMVQKGFIAVFEKNLGKQDISECVVSWLERFEKVEQVIPGMEGTWR